jgi:hypothetical protein
MFYFIVNWGLGGGKLGRWIYLSKKGKVWICILAGAMAFVIWRLVCNVELLRLLWIGAKELAIVAARKQRM